MKKSVILMIIWMFVGLNTSTQASLPETLSTQPVTSVSTRELRFTKLLHIGPVISEGSPKVPVWVNWSPDASYLAVGYYGDTAIRLLDGVTGQEKFTLESPGFMDFFSLVWSPSGNYLAGSFKTLLMSLKVVI